MTEPCDLPAVTARALIGERKLSPVELLESCIHRIEAIDPAVNAVIARSFESARATAQASEAAVMRGDALGPLHGLPLGVKDLIDAKGLPTSFGSVLFKDNIAAEDEAIVAMLKRAGAIVIGKTNVPEWGAGGNTRNALHGATGNPFDPERSAAGSSGGSAVALATGMVPLATGSDTGGSVRNPAAFCGVVGFRPSPGLIASNSRNMAWLQISQLGPMARNVSDACLMLSCMLDRDARDPLSAILHAGGTPVRETYRDTATDRSRRLARSRQHPISDLRRRSAPSPRRSGRSSRHSDRPSAASNGPIRIAAMPTRCSGCCAPSHFWGVTVKLAEKYPDKVGPNIRDNVAEGLGYSALDVARALSLQTALYRSWQQSSANMILSLRRRSRSARGRGRSSIRP